MVGFFFIMGRKKIEFTKEQDECIAQMVNEGHSLNSILLTVNNTFQTNFSRSGIDRRIKDLGIVRSKIDNEVEQSLSKSDIVKYIINKHYYNNSNSWKEYRLRTLYTLDSYAKRIGVSKPTLLKYLKAYNLPASITSDMKEFFDISSVDLRMYKKETIEAIIAYLKNKTTVVVEPNAIIKIGSTDVTVELFFPEYNTVLLSATTDDYYTKKCGETEIPIKLMFEWYNKIRDESNYKVIFCRLEKRTPKYSIQSVCDSIIKDLGLQLKGL